MRARLLIFVLVNFLIISFLVHTVWTLLSLLVVTGASDAISRDDLPRLDPDFKDPTEPEPETKHHPIIPKIIHQTYKTDNVPKVWQEAQQSCKDLHKDWEYKFWTDDNARKFIEEQYNWFLPTWDSYPFGIERADAIRYFVLYHYGGVYIDLDDGCKRSVTPLLAYPAWLRRTTPTGISNDAMGAIPQHPFFNRTIHALQHYKRSWVAPYITVMASTGPLFLSLIWRHHNDWLKHAFTEEQRNEKESARVRLLLKDEYMGKDWSFFTHHKGDSWHQWDSDLLFWMRSHWLLLTIAGFVVAGFIFAGLWYCFSGIFRGGRGPPAMLGSPRERGHGKGGASAGGGLMEWWRRRGKRRRLGRKEYVELSRRDEED